MDGIINVYKEAGFTSFDVVAKLRGILKQKKIGHTGTLDPDAEGVLPICIGKATKICEYLTEKDKVYEAVLHLGIVTDTQDISGSVLETKTPEVTEQEISTIISGFVGKQQQIPPMYSALKVNGQKLCDLARKGIEVERKARDIEIFSIDILSIEMPFVSIRVHCSKGTYIRTLCQDIGEALGCGGCMEKLLRTKTGGFSIEHALKLKDIEDIVNERSEQKLEDILIPVDKVLEVYPAVTADRAADKLLLNGNRIPDALLNQKELKNRENYRMYNAKGTFIGIFSYNASKKECKPEKMFL
ncbi:MAG: tRNA pseudouridine(55) synthase TruB [Lachnospiraceae bacterium]|nr:tRNA pseudouridine(55) synthase TruB [Lachnospiraceae bacterium]